MTESIINRINQTAEHFFDDQADLDRSGVKKVHRKILHYLAHQKHTNSTTPIHLDDLAKHINYPLDSDKLIAVMLPLLLEDAITYQDVSNRIRVRLKGT